MNFIPYVVMNKRHVPTRHVPSRRGQVNDVVEIFILTSLAPISQVFSCKEGAGESSIKCPRPFCFNICMPVGVKGL